MAAITAFPDIMPTQQGQYQNTVSYIAGADILAGQTVTFGSTAGTVVPATGTTTVLGVAIADADNGCKVTVQVDGIAYVANADGSTAIAQGAFVATGAYAGAVAAATSTLTAIVGQALEPIAGGSYGRIRVAPRTYGA